jgi:hypothetical protein
MSGICCALFVFNQSFSAEKQKFFTPKCTTQYLYERRKFIAT